MKLSKTKDHPLLVAGGVVAAAGLVAYFNSVAEFHEPMQRAFEYAVTGAGTLAGAGVGAAASAVAYALLAGASKLLPDNTHQALLKKLKLDDLGKIGTLAIAIIFGGAAYGAVKGYEKTTDYLAANAGNHVKAETTKTFKP